LCVEKKKSAINRKGFIFSSITTTQLKTEDLHTLFLQDPQIFTDTRESVDGGLFFALRGEHFNGNTFAGQALLKGARFAVVDEKMHPADPRYIYVKNALKTLQELASFHRKKLGIPVVAITGSNGKTTTKELCAAILSKKYTVVATKGNRNNAIGVPLTLLQFRNNTDLGIIEMGTNHPGEIKKLCALADPDYGLITNVGKAHLEGFGSLEGVKQEKAELYRYLEKKNGKIFLHSDNKDLLRMAGKKTKAILYGSSDSLSLKGEIVQSAPFLTVKVWFPEKVSYVKSQLTGTYNFENILASACVGKYFGVEPSLIQQAIREYKPENYRSQFFVKGSNKIIIDAYNANPTSMQASVSHFMQMKGKNKCLILGDMLELGRNALTEHQKIVSMIEPVPFAHVFLVGSLFSQMTVPEIFSVFETTESLAEYLKKNPLTDSFIFIKGSRSIGLEKILDYV
jgi:UDP-N-acetylmuramoyl-tripeptide--D-alanyl-D-alanine ligase